MHALRAAVFAAVTVANTASAEPKYATVGPGTLRLFYPIPRTGGGDPIKTMPVAKFALATLPVTNGEFLAFVRNNEAYRRDRIGRLFADEGYLGYWASPTELGPKALPEQPVVRVSWFAAKAYCKAHGARLPLEKEWEFAAMAGQKSADGRDEPGWRERMETWFSTPNKTLPKVGSQDPNFWGVQDLHAVVWEWVLDFNSTLVSADNRESGDKDKDRFCGAGALSADDKTDYISFMRTAFRSALRPDMTTENLGFRCARNAASTPSGEKP